MKGGSKLIWLRSGICARECVTCCRHLVHRSA